VHRKIKREEFNPMPSDGHGIGSMTIVNGTYVGGSQVATPQTVYVEIFDSDVNQTLSIGKLSLSSAATLLAPRQKGAFTVKNKYVTVLAVSNDIPNLKKGAVTVKRGSTAPVELWVLHDKERRCLKLSLFQNKV
jgi:hypothetical protein